MKIAVVGCGAMGSVYAALLADAGHEVWAIDSWKEHVDAMRAKGLRLEGASGDRTVRLNATTNPADAGPCDLAILATKAMHVEKAAQSMAPLIGKDTVVLSIQNGLGGPDTAARVLGRERVMVGVVGGFGASMKGPGHAHHNGWELVRLGEFSGPVSARLRRIEDVWKSGGFKVKGFDDIDQLVWEKLICNVCYSGTCSVTERTIAEVMNDPDTWLVASGCATEAYNVARARGIKLDFNDPVAYVRAFGEKIPNARPSMLLDHMAGRMSEIEAINGAIPPAAKAAGVAAPYNEVISALVRAKERRMGVRP
ncbi:MAG TPA: 2-dehydropantoate 2-reductase [Burkholderiales bacterium]|jgi:2-dehydropantoate 2-reductase|nr:2-dehydropantoate 2-reductase [Burkholderiales bacterium]